MSETTAQTNGVTSQYVAQVAGDLERNLKEQDRVAGEIASLQEQLASLEKDRTVLLNVQQALGVEPASTAPTAGKAAVEETTTGKAGVGKAAVEKATAVPAPRKKAPTGASRRVKAAKPAAAAKPAVKKAAAREAAPKPAPKPDQPSLVSLVREHLAGQSEPRSAAEVAQSLGGQHPERGIKTTVVRTTLEGLVAKNHAQRSKQGTSVFYTSPEAPAAPATVTQEAPREGRSA
ncbi:hypothetical protein [Streptomyces sp. NPDC003522]